MSCLDTTGNHLDTLLALHGFGPDGIHFVTNTKYDPLGYDWCGFNEAGFNRLGFDMNGFASDGIDERGYDRNGRLQRFSMKLNIIKADQNDYSVTPTTRAHRRFSKRFQTNPTWRHAA